MEVIVNTTTMDGLGTPVSGNVSDINSNTSVPEQCESLESEYLPGKYAFRKLLLRVNCMCSVNYYSRYGFKKSFD